MTLVDTIAGYVSGLSLDTIPTRVLDSARDRLLDALSTALASRDMKATQAIIAAVQVAGHGAGPSTVISNGTSAGAQDAALINGTAVHAVLFEDYYAHNADHPSATIVPAALAAAEASGDLRGRAPTIGDLLVAIVAGYEVEVKLGDIVATGIRARGLRTTGILGTVGASAAAASAFGLSADRTAAAISMGANLAHGFLEGFAHGTMEPYIHAGTAARNGILAAHMGYGGVRTAPLSLEGRTGYLATLGDLAPAEHALPVDDWGILRVTAKSYPLSGGARTTVDTALDLLAQGVRGQDVDGVVIRLPHRSMQFPGLNNQGPFTSMNEVQDSIQFAAAAALLGRPMHSLKTVMLGYADAEVAELCQRIEVVGEDDRVVDGKVVSQIDVTLRDGRTFSSQVDLPADHLRTVEAMSEKLRLLSDGAWPARQTERVIELIVGDSSTPIEAFSAALLGSD